MEDLKIILSLAGTAFGLLVAVLTFLSKTIKNAKARKLAEQAIQIGNAVLPYIQEAEKFTAYSGAEKKAYVMTKANQFAIQSGISFNAEQISEKIEELVALTRQVNARVKPAEKEATAKQKIGTASEIQETVSQKSWL